MNSSISITLWNANGLLSRKLELDQFLEREQVDIALITETHCTAATAYNQSGPYLVYHTFHPSGKARGGVAIYIRNRLQHSLGHSKSTVYLQMTSISLTIRDAPTTIAVSYISPSHTLDDNDITGIFTLLGPRWILGGDFNAKHPHWGSSSATPRGRLIYGKIVHDSLTVASSGEPTYWPLDPDRTPGVIDFFILKGFPAPICHTSTITDLTSDHLPIKLRLTTDTVPLTRPLPLVTKHTDWDIFRSELSSNLNLGIRLKSTSELDEAAEYFTQALQEAASKATPAITPTVTPQSVGYPSTLLQLIRDRRRARRKWQRTRSYADYKTFRQLARQSSKELRDFRDKRVSTFLSDLAPTKEKNYSLWKATRKFRKAPVTPIPPLRAPTGWSHSDKEKAIAFADHLQQTFQPNNILSTVNLCGGRCPSRRFKPISPIELAYIIDHLNTHKAPGADKITARMLQELPKKGVVFFTYLCNAALRLQYVPKIWKQAKVIMLHKPNKPAENVSSYRPISLLSVLSKVFEKLFHNRLQRLICELKLIPDSQFGFRQKHSTIDQVHRVTQTVLTAFEKKEHCPAVFLDVSQAFDKVWHGGLHVKLSRLLPANYCRLIRNYLTDRSFFITYGSAESTHRPIAAGVPQGSVLGPT